MNDAPNNTLIAATLKITALCLLMCSLVLPANAQRGNQQDEKPENLQVLPETMTMQQVRRVMFQFTGALGVRCSHCHVGQEGEPLSTYDFVSDEIEAKETTRAMMRMVSAINEDHIKQLPNGDERIEVNCTTCHHGIAKPALLEDVLADHLSDHDVEETLAYYETLKDKYYGGFSYNFQERTLNTLAQRFVSMQDPETALAFLELNLGMYPNSAGAYALMGQAYLQQENQPAAIESLEKSLELNPDNRRVKAQLEQLQGDQ